ncbi:class I mannose-6-phosphate isomerase [Mucilaginibacter sp. BJC16-A38]|uniref:class I mannose-6-phosphate isomerase n=1 Tax=Mucilaginibacter phenanthrenivorans TaxID=1234842 RepID=UPI002158635C|nr:class I mannose-6-phosphate isomerase [Mucilaginibacter phenanthrenivorans]MCR8556261.1 class I mannose-6-phosphate isomerase [Mucilaginibacter phenanthrenivorans]
MNLNTTTDNTANKTETEKQLRKSSQYLMPTRLDNYNTADGVYDIYPVSNLGNGKIFNGYASLAQWIVAQKTVVIDGYEGVFYNTIIEELEKQINAEGLEVNWVKTSDYLKSSEEINELIQPFLGEGDSVWGTRCTLQLQDFYRAGDLSAQTPDNACDINIVIGTAAILCKWDAPVIYIDLPKNELQFRMRAGSVYNLGGDTLAEPFLMYKRFYFVDWVLLNQHKKENLNKITVVADGQWPTDINWMLTTDFKDGLNKISKSTIRVRPWFEPGAWGGQWLKQHIPNVNEDVVNYAWSFELIVPENGLVFESDGWLLEASFDFLMFHNHRQVLGKHADNFGHEFPIRFDFLDTYDGGNLSIQCHPRLKYIQDVFGETITQDETYYILDCEADANVYLGFQEDIEPEKFRNELERSQDENIELNITDFVQSHPAKKHDLFLIPNGTVHSAGAGNLVLEISATPYIFTFKMYDWLRLDLDGNPRPINIDHAFNNLYFDRKGEKVKEELISKPSVIGAGNDWELIHLPTHAEHFYDVHSIDFDSEVTVENNDCCHVMMLVEGHSVLVETADGSKRKFAYAETFVIPAAATGYKLTNLGKSKAKVIKAFLK